MRPQRPRGGGPGADSCREGDVGARNALHLKRSGCQPGCGPVPALAAPRSRNSPGGATSCPVHQHPRPEPLLGCPDLQGQGGGRAPTAGSPEGLRRPAPPAGSSLPEPLRRPGPGVGAGRRPGPWDNGGGGGPAESGGTWESSATRKPGPRSPGSGPQDGQGGRAGGAPRAGREAAGGRAGAGRAPWPDVQGHMLAHGVMEHSCRGPGVGARGRGQGGSPGL